MLWPAINLGMAFRWIGVGTLYPFAIIALNTGADKPID
jgi:hypothetical protein